MTVRISTFSIAGYCVETGMLGVAVSTAIPAVGALCPFVRSGVGAAATQAWVNPYLGVRALDFLEKGQTPSKALSSALATDPDAQRRQLLLIDARGETAAHTGTSTYPWCGQVLGRHCAAGGNMLVGEKTVTSLVETFENESGLGLPERLLRALEAGQAAGGDARGRQSAALLVHHTEDYPYCSLRVDEHADPVKELRRVWVAWKKMILPLIPMMPTKAHPAGQYDVEALRAYRTRAASEP